jgi:hypothetical protein
MPRGVNADDAQSFGAGRRFSEEIIKISTSTRRQKNKNYYRGGGDRGMPPEGNSVSILLLLCFLYTMIPGAGFEAGSQVLGSKQCKQTKI